jgi:hypothetical protein
VNGGYPPAARTTGDFNGVGFYDPYATKGERTAAETTTFCEEVD